MTTVASASAVMHNVDEYERLLESIRQRFATAVAGGSPLFTTDAAGLFDAFLGGLPEGATRQHYTCHACRRFVEGYGGLVTIEADGSTSSVLWDAATVPGLYRASVEAMSRLVSRARVTGVFLSSDAKWGNPSTKDGKRDILWYHMAVVPPRERLFRGSALKSAGQAAAEKIEDYRMLSRSLVDFPRDLALKAHTLLTSGQLYRAEKCVDVAKWFLDLHEQREAAPKGQRENLTWLAVATAPAGFCHVRSSMIGTLLEDLAAGMDFAQLKRRFEEKMDPMAYRRPTAAPSTGQIAAAEKAVEALGIVPAFARRYTIASDLDAPGATLWTPSEGAARPVAAIPKASGVFDHLKPVSPSLPELDIPPRRMTWEKFERDVLPGAALLEYRVPLIGRFSALTAAADPGAPPILQWDDPARRNSASWSFPNPPARADEWGLVPGSLVRVQRIVSSPNLWNDAAARFAAHGRGVFLLLEGARDVRGLPGGGFFPEHLRGELTPYRSTIEAHVNSLVVAGADAPDAMAFGIGLFAGGDWTEVAAPHIGIGSGSTPAAAPRRVHVILVVDDSGSMASYIGAARAALASLLSAVRAMPGQVDVSVVIFGSFATLLCDRAPLASAEGIERRLTGGSGQTALNDALAESMEQGLGWPDAGAADTSFFLGIVTDGEENHSRRRTMQAVAQLVAHVNATGRWTLAYAGAGRDPRTYARSVGIPAGNVTVFEASARGFEDIGQRYAASARSLAGVYASGARASTSFFAAASANQAIGQDHPVLIVTSKSGAQAGYELDRWD